MWENYQKFSLLLCLRCLRAVTSKEIMKNLVSWIRVDDETQSNLENIKLLFCDKKLKLLGIMANNKLESGSLLII